jgi:hypothetical protein
MYDSTSATLYCKKTLAIFASQAGIKLPNSPKQGIIKLFPTRESLVKGAPVRFVKIFFSFRFVFASYSSVQAKN